jgi:hypothetical protein
MKQTSTTVSVICMIIIIACNIGIYKYIEKLEKENCDCAKNIKVVKFIKPSALIVSVIILIRLLSSLTGTPLSKQKCMQNMLGRLINLLIKIYLFAYYVCIIVYFAKLVNRLCDCSKKRERVLLLYPVILMGISIPIAIILVASGALKK